MILALFLLLQAAPALIQPQEAVSTVSSRPEVPSSRRLPLGEERSLALLPTESETTPDPSAQGISQMILSRISGLPVCRESLKESVPSNAAASALCNGHLPPTESGIPNPCLSTLNKRAGFLLNGLPTSEMVIDPTETASLSGQNVMVLRDKVIRDQVNGLVLTVHLVLTVLTTHLVVNDFTLHALHRTEMEILNPRLSGQGLSNEMAPVILSALASLTTAPSPPALKEKSFHEQEDRSFSFDWISGLEQRQQEGFL